MHHSGCDDHSSNWPRPVEIARYVWLGLKRCIEIPLRPPSPLFQTAETHTSLAPAHANRSCCYIHSTIILPNSSRPVLLQGRSRTLNQHLDCTRLRTRRTRLKCGYRILQIESMGHQSLHVEDTALHEADGTGPGVGVSVLEL